MSDFSNMLPEGEALLVQIQKFNEGLRPELDRQLKEVEETEKQCADKKRQIKLIAKRFGVKLRSGVTRKGDWFDAQMSKFKSELKTAAKIPLNSSEARRRIASEKLKILLSPEYAKQFGTLNELKAEISRRLPGVAKALNFKLKTLLDEAIEAGILSKVQVNEYLERVTLQT